jgi:methionine-rich copper-binding protein CopC
MTGEDNSPIQRYFRAPHVYLLVSIALALFCVALTSATPGDAHSDLLRSSPISDTVLPASPGEIIFFFAEPVVVETSDVQLVDSADAPYDLDDFQSRRLMAIRLREASLSRSSRINWWARPA